MEFKVIIYLIGGVLYFVYKQYEKLQKEAVSRKAKLEGEIKPYVQPAAVEIQKPLQRVKSERQQLDAESARLRELNKMRSAKTPKPFFDKPEHVNSVFSQSDDSSLASRAMAVTAAQDENFVRDEIDIRKMILYSELLKRPAW